jgi:hypothetical protein
VEQFRPPQNTPILFALAPGWWCEYREATGDPNPEVASWQAINPVDEFWKPLPLNKAALAGFGWEGTTYGQVQNIAHQLAISVEATGPEGSSLHFSPAEVRRYWTGPHQYDAWWEAWLGAPPTPLFNPNIDAGNYLNRLLLPVGPFPAAGSYHFSFTINQVLPWVDLFDFGAHRATHNSKGIFVGTWEGDFSVQ